MQHYTHEASTRCTHAYTQTCRQLEIASVGRCFSISSSFLSVLFLLFWCSSLSIFSFPFVFFVVMSAPLLLVLSLCLSLAIGTPHGKMYISLCVCACVCACVLISSFSLG